MVDALIVKASIKKQICIWLYPYSESCGFSSSHVQMWGLDHKEGWVPKNWCFWTVVLEKTLESLMDFKEIEQSILKEINQCILKMRPGCSLEGLMLKLKLQYFGHLIGKDPDSGKDWGQEEKGTTKDEMVGWHHWLYRHEFEQAPGIGMDREAWVLYSMGLQRVRHYWATELNWT